MNATNVTAVSGVLIDETTLTIYELANACSVEHTWVVRHVEDGQLECVEIAVGDDTGNWHFGSAALVRARRLASIERTFDANPEVTALVVDLLEEVAALRRRLAALAA